MYSHNLKKQIKNTNSLLLAGFLAAISACSFMVYNGGNSNAKGGGGTPGEGVTYAIRYDEANCPLPASVKADYETILSCGLVKRTGQNKSYYLRVDGFTQLTPVVRDIRSNSTVVLPCGDIATVTKFTENAFAQTSPVPPPYRLYTESIKFTDTCL